MTAVVDRNYAILSAIHNVHIGSSRLRRQCQYRKIVGNQYPSYLDDTPALTEAGKEAGWPIRSVLLNKASG